MLHDLISGGLDGASDMLGCLMIAGAAAIFVLGLLGLISRLLG